MENKESDNKTAEDKMPNWDFPSGSFDDSVSADKKKNRKEQVADIGTKSLALVGAVALIALFIWGGTQAIRALPSDLVSNLRGSLVATVSNITSIFVSRGEKNPIIFTLETHNVRAEEAFDLTWTHDENRSGAYVFSYGCREGVNIEVRNENGEDTPVLCETTHPLESGEGLLSFTAFSTEDRFVDVPVTVSFIPSDAGEATVSASTLLTLVNEELGSIGIEETDIGITTDTTTTVSPGAQTNETYIIDGATGGGGISDPAGTPDLSVTVIAVGVLDKLTNDFTPGVVVGENERAAIRFEVRNIGTKTSGEWSFIIDLPISSGLFVFRPDNKQRSLNPGERIEYTLGFDSIDRTTGTASAVINVDTERQIAETNRDNNTASATFTVDQS